MTSIIEHRKGIGMKITIEEKQDESEYPCLKESDGLMVLFTDKKTGIVLRRHGSFNVGYYSYQWVEEKFKPFEGKITIEQ